MATDPKPRTITFSDGKTVNAKWLDDFSEDQIDAMNADASSSQGLKGMLAAWRSIVILFCHDVTEEYLRSLPIREVERIVIQLRRFESSPESENDAVPLGTAAESGSTAPPSSPAS